MEAAGRTGSFEEFYRAYFSDVYRYVYRIFLDRDVAEDVVQEVFCAALENYGEVSGHPYPRRWLFCTAKNKVRETRRKLRRWDNNMASLDQENAELSRKEFSYEVKELELAGRAMLGEKEWKIIEKHYLFGVTVAELAKTEGITENNMRVRLT